MVSFRALLPFSSSIDVLHAAFAPGPLADDHRPLVVLQTGGDDFAGAGAVAIDQHDHRKALEGAVLVGVPDPFRAVAALGADDAAAGNEQVADFDGRAEQPARIETQIEDQPAQLFAAASCCKRIAQFVGRIAAERRQPHVADALLADRA